MRWIDVAWPMMAAASLTLGAIHLLAWLRMRSRYEFLVFFVIAVSAAGFAIGEWLLMRADSPQRYGEILRWLHVVIFSGTVSIVAFVLLTLRAGRMWLFWTACGARLAGMVLNFLSDPNIHYRAITGLRRVEILGGDAIAVPVGIPGPFQWFDEVINVLVLWFVADAAIAAWRRGDPDSRRRAVVIGGGFFLFFLAAAGQAALLHEGLMDPPYFVAVGFLGIVALMGHELGRDVIRAVLLTARLHASEQRMDLAAGAADLALWEWNVARDEMWVTERGRALFGFAAGDRIDLETFLARVHADDRDRVRATLTEGQRGPGAFEAEFRIVLPDGSIRWLGGRGRVESDRAGAPALMRGVSLDVTARKEGEDRARRMELEAARQRDELAHLSRVAMLGALSGSLAHELNQPLAAILSNAQAAQRFLARDPADTDQVREILADIVKSDRRAGEVIRRLRALLKNEEAVHVAQDLNAVVREVLELMHSDFLNRRVTVRTELAPGLPPVSGDRIQLQQVLLNLLLNGCDAMEGAAGERLLTVRTDRAANGDARVCVADRGAGIPPAELERIFEPFVTSKPHGMGLGLAVSRTIVQAHAGRLWAANNADGGAIFCFSLPANE